MKTLDQLREEWGPGLHAVRYKKKVYHAKTHSDALKKLMRNHKMKYEEADKHIFSNRIQFGYYDPKKKKFYDARYL
jgi:hypothetical protein